MHLWRFELQKLQNPLKSPRPLASPRGSFARENCLFFERRFCRCLKRICGGYYKEHGLEHTLVRLLKLPIVPREGLLITFGNNLIFPDQRNAAVQGDALSFTNNHLNRATKETQVLPKPQLTRERL